MQGRAPEGGDAQRPADHGRLDAPRLGDHHLQHPQHTACVRDGPRTGGRGPGTVPPALEQHDAQLPFDAAHRVRDGGLGAPEPGTGGREAALVGDRHQGPELLRRKIDRLHSGSPTCCYEDDSWTDPFHERNRLPDPRIPAYGPVP